MRTTLVFFICFFGINLLRADDALRSIQVEARSEVRVAPDEAVLDFYISSSMNRSLKQRASMMSLENCEGNQTTQR